MRVSVCAHCVLVSVRRAHWWCCCGRASRRLDSFERYRMARAQPVPATEGQSARQRRSASLCQTLSKCWPLCERVLSNET
eukprot:3860423-Pleurochrysis_carterae.AAC.2